MATRGRFRMAPTVTDDPWITYWIVTNVKICAQEWRDIPDAL
jgi:hypothetical protein